MVKILEGPEAQKKFEELKKNGNIIYETIVGSHSYGLNVKESDLDKKFVYVEPLSSILSGDYVSQINLTDDYVGYEIGRLIELLGKQNANISELIFCDEAFVTHSTEIFDRIIKGNRMNLLSKMVSESYGKYAYSQIKKAKTTSKKFLQDFSGPRKELIDFAWVNLPKKKKTIFNFWKKTAPYGVTPLKEYIDYLKLDINKLAISKIDHMGDLYNLYEVNDGSQYGIFSKNMTEVKLADIPKKNTRKLNDVSINKDGFSTYCKKYKEWNEWNEKKNPVRFSENLESADKYDRKNMMHCHRLLNMAIEILEGKGVKVFRENDREELLKIRYGEKKYQELVDSANEKIEKISQLKETSSLPEEVAKEFLKFLLLKFRSEFYNLHNF